MGNVSIQLLFRGRTFKNYWCVCVRVCVCVCVCVHMNMQAPVYKSWSGPLPLCPGTTSPILLPCYKLQSRWSRIIYVSSCLCLLFRSKSAGITDMHLHTWILFLTMGSRIEFRLSGNLLSLLSHLAEVEVTVESWVYSPSFCINRVIIGEADVQSLCWIWAISLESHCLSHWGADLRFSFSVRLFCSLLSFPMIIHSF